MPATTMLPASMLPLVLLLLAAMELLGLQMHDRQCSKGAYLR